ncbi:MAG: ABC-2 family transporter protein [Spirochaetales bacterium]|nr:ABC-2 family transporter protein [Spirochaetales bacterium]
MIYGKMILAAIASRMEYRGSFIVFILTLVGFYAAQVAVIGVMIYRFKSIGGWTAGEIAFLYALLVLSQGIVAMLFAGLIDFSTYVREGSFDRVLLRPLSPMLQILCLQFDPAGITHLSLGVIALVIANGMLDLAWSFSFVFYMFLSITGGALILAAIRIMVAATAFFTVSNQGLQHLFVFSSREFLLYPVSIYARPVQYMLTFIMPIAFVNFYPAHLFLGRDASTLIHPAFIYLTFPTGILMMGIAFLFWRAGTRAYSSTGN